MAQDWVKARPIAALDSYPKLFSTFGAIFTVARCIDMRTDCIMAKRLARLGKAQVETQRCALEEMRTLGINTGVAEALHRSFARLMAELARAQKSQAH